MDTPLNILVVEDHDDLREATVAALTDMGHAVRGVDCAEAMDEALWDFRAEIVLLDLNLPSEDGLSIAHRLRAAEPGIGIIMVTARDTPGDVMAGYGSGADIYATKPTSPEELDAAIQALSRRIRPAIQVSSHLRLNLQALNLAGPRGTTNISGADAQILAALARARDQRLETWQLLELLGKEVNDLEKRTLRVQIVRLRKKLEQTGAPEPIIKSIRGTGYQLCIGLRIDLPPT